MINAYWIERMWMESVKAESILEMLIIQSRTVIIT